MMQSGAYAPAWQSYQGDHNLEAYIRGVADHCATDRGCAAKILHLAHGARAAAVVVEARQRAADGSGG
jgi:hypothetical protein